MSLNSMLFQELINQQDGNMPAELKAAFADILGAEDTATVIDSTARDVTGLASGDHIDLRNWQQEAERSERIIEALSAKLEMLACAVGACPSCWGADGDCSGCGGHNTGGPGAFLPDPDCFDRYIAPVLREMVAQNPSSRRANQRQLPSRIASSHADPLPPQTETET